MHLRARRLQGRQDVRVRVAVPVVGADADHRHPRADGREEGWIGRARTVVRDGEHLGAQLLRPFGQQPALGLVLDVTRQEHPGAAVRHPQHQGGLVQLAARVAVGATGRRVQDLDGDVTEPDRRVGGRGEHADAAVGRRRQ